MSWNILAVFVALLIAKMLPKVCQWRNFSWYEHWLDFLQHQLANTRFWNTGYNLLFSVLLPALVLKFLVFWLQGVTAFLVALIFVWYCWGPRDLDADVQAILDAENVEDQGCAAKNLFEEGVAVRFDGALVVAAVFENALARWFSVLFWFIVFGPAGALAYRLLHVHVHQSREIIVPNQSHRVAEKILNMAHCPPAHLMTFSMALAADFDKVISVWRAWYKNGGLRFDYGFLATAASESVASELAEEAADAEDGPASGPALLELRDAMSLAWRMLLLWLALLAVFVLAGLVV